MKILARLFSEWVPRIKFQIKKAKFEHNVFQMGPSVFWITSALGPLSKSYFVPLKLGGQRQHVKIWKCLVFCPTFRQFSSPQPFPFHNHQRGQWHCRCLLFVTPVVTHSWYLTTRIKPCDTHLFFLKCLLAIVSCCEPFFHFLFPKSWYYVANVTEEELKNRLDIDYDILYRKVR